MNNLWSGRKQCTIIKYPSGKYGFVGSLPLSLTTTKRNSIGQEYQASKVFNTEQQAQIELELATESTELWKPE